MKGNTIFEGLTRYRFYILLSLDFVADFKNKK